MSIASAKLPAVVVTGVLCLVVGVGGGLVLASFVDLGLKPEAVAAAPADVKDASPKAIMPGGGMGGMPGGGKGGGAPGGGKGGGGAKGPSTKVQLAQLVGKLETLSKKPLAVELTADQKKEVKSLLADLDAKDALSDEDAKAKLDALLKLLESQRATLEAAGYRWPGSAFAPPVETPPNPFKEGDSAAKLNSLRESLGR